MTNQDPDFAEEVSVVRLPVAQVDKARAKLEAYRKKPSNRPAEDEGLVAQPRPRLSSDKAPESRQQHKDAKTTQRRNENQGGEDVEPDAISVSDATGVSPRYPQAQIDAEKETDVENQEGQNEEEEEDLQPGAVHISGSMAASSTRPTQDEPDLENRQEQATGTTTAEYPRRNPLANDDVIVTATVVVERNENNGRDPPEYPGYNGKIPLCQRPLFWYFLIVLLLLVAGGVGAAVALLIGPRDNGENNTDQPPTVSPTPGLTQPPTIPPLSSIPTSLPSAAPSSSPSKSLFDIIAVFAGNRSDDGVGQSVAMNYLGTVVAFGAPQSVFSPRSQHGYIRVFGEDIVQKRWIQLGSDVVIGLENGDEFGYSVSVNGNGTRIAAGARLGNSTGYVQVLEWNGAGFLPKGSAMYGEESSSQFGHAVALSGDGNTVVAGAPFYDGSVGFSSGQARVFRFDGNDWQPYGQTLFGESLQGEFGRSVAISNNGETVVIGNPGHNTGVFGAGRVLVLEMNSVGNWTRVGTLDAFTLNANFGTSVSVSGDGRTIAVGAPRHREVFHLGGLVRVYQRTADNSTEWVQVGQDLLGQAEDNLFGISVSLSDDGQVLGVGMSRGGSTGGGQAQVYRHESSSMMWVPIADEVLEREEPQPYANFGTSIGVSGDGNTISVGDPDVDSPITDAGEVSIFRL